MRNDDTARNLFSGIASTYDTPAQFFSLFQYRRWHRILLDQLGTAPAGTTRPAMRVLDMATGTGALALRLAGRSNCNVVAADITRPMLQQARHRILGNERRGSIDLVECTAETLPFPDGSFDALIFTYLLRYVSDVPSTIQELARAVRPGGSMLSLDFAVPRGLAYPAWRLHTSLVLPLGGSLISSAWGRVGAFLGDSIRDFCRRWPEPKLIELWRQAGFLDARARRLSLGGALMIWGTKAT